MTYRSHEGFARATVTKLSNSEGFRALAGAGFWLKDLEQLRKRSNRHADLSGTGIYCIRDVLAGPEAFYVGIARQDPTTTRNPNADGIGGRLSTHRNTESPVLARWYRYTHPDLPKADLANLPANRRMSAGPMRNRVRAEAFNRLRVTYFACSAELARQVEAYIVHYGVPGLGVSPVLNMDNWTAK